MARLPSSTLLLTSLLTPVLLMSLVHGDHSMLQRTITAMFSPPPNRLSDPSQWVTTAGRCRWLPASRQQQSMCRDPGVPAALQQAHRMAVQHCQKHFRFELWNCSMRVGQIRVFNKIYRETALLYALASAAIAHAVAQACVQGHLKHCVCQADNVCTNSIWYGRRFTRHFLQLRETRGDVMLRHNSEVGLQVQVLATDAQESCRCHGMSGSCSARICWNQLTPFHVTVAMLKERYHEAVWSDTENLSSLDHTTLTSLSPLMFLEPTPGLCAATHGRRCIQARNCATVCCGRGYHHYYENRIRYCHCRWEAGYQLHCDQCSIQEEVYICK